MKYSPEGKLLQMLEDSEGKIVRAVTEVEEKDGQLWIGSVLVPFIAVYILYCNNFFSTFDLQIYQKFIF